MYTKKINELYVRRKIKMTLKEKGNIADGKEIRKRNNARKRGKGKRERSNERRRMKKKKKKEVMKGEGKRKEKEVMKGKGKQDD